MFKRKKKDEGPFKANRILDTPEVKVDQVYTRIDEKPVALFATITEDEAKKIGAEGFAGPTQLGAKGEYETDKKWVTRAVWFPTNIPQAQFNENIHMQIRNSLATEGTIVPSNIPFEKVEDEKTIRISGAASLKTYSSGDIVLSGSIPVITPVTTRVSRLKIMKFCPNCGSEIEVTSKTCPICGKQITQ